MNRYNQREGKIEERYHSFLMFVNKLDLLNKTGLIPQIDKIQIMPRYNDIVAKIKRSYN